jgi:hypothetical protein
MDKTPIIMLTGKSDNYDKLKALDLWNGWLFGETLNRMSDGED